MLLPNELFPLCWVDLYKRRCSSEAHRKKIRNKRCPRWLISALESPGVMAFNTKIMRIKNEYEELATPK